MENLQQDPMKIHTPLISFLICLGLGINGMFLMSVKADKPKLNYNDKIQGLKTVFVIFAIIFYIPAELWVMQRGHVTVIACVLKETLQSALLDVYPFGITAVAIIRFRLAICRGNADVLVSKAFYLSTTIFCFSVPFVMAITKVFVLNSIMDLNLQNETETQEMSICFDTHTYGINYLKIGNNVLVYLLPTILTTVFYVGIIRISSTSISRIQQSIGFGSTTPNARRRASIIPGFFVQNRVYPTYREGNQNNTEQQSRGEKICRSVTTLVAFFLITMLPIVIIEIYTSFTMTNMTFSIILLYMKTFMCIFHAVGEGVFQQDKRRRVLIFLYKYVIRTSVTPTITRRISPDIVEQIIFHNKDHLSTLSEESDSGQNDDSCDTCDSVFMPNGISPSKFRRLSHYSQVSELMAISRSFEAINESSNNQIIEETCTNVEAFSMTEISSPKSSQQKQNKESDDTFCNKKRKCKDDNLSPKQLHKCQRCQRSSFLQYNIPVMMPSKKCPNSTHSNISKRLTFKRPPNLVINDAQVSNVYSISGNIPQVLLTPRKRTSFDRLNGLSSVTTIDQTEELSPITTHVDDTKKNDLIGRDRNLSLLSDTL